MEIDSKQKVKLLPFIVATAFFMQMLDQSILNTAIPRIAQYINEKPVNMSATVMAYTLSAAFFLPVSGWLSERFGIKRIFLLSLIIFTAGSFLCAISDTLFKLTASRVIQGIGGALMVPIGRLAILRVFPRDQYVKVISFIVMPALIGPLIGPTVGGFIVEYFTWHWIFLINIPIGILCFVFSLYIMPQIPRARATPKFDWLGFFIFDSAVIFFFLFGGTGGISLLLPKPLSFAIAVGLLVVYFLYAKGKKGVLFELELFKTRNFTVGILGNFIARLSGGALPFVAPLFLQTALGYSPSKAGIALIPLSVGAIFVKSFVARLIARFGHKKFMTANTIVLGIFIACVAFIGIDTPFYMVLIVYGLIGMANSMQFTAINTLTMIDVPAKLLSEANSLFSITMQLCMALGISFCAILLSTVVELPKFALPVAAFHLVYIIIGAFTLMNFLIFLMIREDKAAA
ncbi:MAG: MFS transporter [Elusimicrobiota bacterium]|jgi:EmrB/QacA subfamily drug resistance transporter|nr:MFS transporter [Elusimicrobiota bacterium]